MSLERALPKSRPPANCFAEKLARAELAWQPRLLVNLTRLRPEFFAILILGAFVLLAIQSARLFFARWLPKRRLLLARERGAEGEIRAEALLRRLGYTIVGRQVRSSYSLTMDGIAVTVDLRADFVVERDDVQFVAEVKTGRFAPRLDTPATRRQLLEYRMAFDTAGVLLVDADSGRVSTVDFPFSAPIRIKSGKLGWVVLGLVLGSLLTIVAARLLSQR